MTNGTNITTTDYLDGFQYINGDLQFFPTPEGYVRVTGNPAKTKHWYDYVYNYTDHLGNIRFSYTQNPSTGGISKVEENHYYPFGLEHGKYNSGKKDYKSLSDNTRSLLPISNDQSYKYKYNGKELQDELGLNVYHYGWRQYDAALGRFNKMDRFSEKYYSKSPYNYAANNPIRFVDAKGDSLWITFGDKNQHRVLYQNGQLLNKDGSQYKGAGVRVKKNGSIKITNSYLKGVVNALNISDTTKEGGNMISQLQTSRFNYSIQKGEHRFDADNNANAAALYLFSTNSENPFSKPLDGIGSGGTIRFNPSMPSEYSSEVRLSHELRHATDASLGILNRITRISNGLGGKAHRSTPISELRGVYSQNRVAQELGQYPLRPHYESSNHPTTLDQNSQPINYGLGFTPSILLFMNN